MADGNGKGRDDTFLTDILVRLGAPVTNTNLLLLRAWQRAEGSSASWNPFNTTQNAKGATSYKGTPVKNYSSREEGLAATVHTLNLPYYSLVVKALRSANAASFLNALVNSPWAGGHYNANKTRGGGFDYATSSVFKVYQGLVGNNAAPNPATVPAANSGKNTLPVWGKQGDGTQGTVIFDPLAPAAVYWRQLQGPGILPKRIDLRLWLGDTNYGADAYAQVRPHVKYTISPGYAATYGKALQAAGAGADPGQVNEIPLPGLLLGLVNTEGGATPLGEAVGTTADTIDTAVSWTTALGGWLQGVGAARIGLVLLGAFVILVAIVLANKDLIPTVVPIPV